MGASTKLRRDAARLKAQAARLLAEAQVLEAAADAVDRLPRGEQSATVDPMEPAHRLAISRSRTPAGASWLHQEASARGLSLRGMAGLLGVSVSYLSMIGRGTKPEPADLRDRVAKLPKRS